MIPPIWHLELGARKGCSQERGPEISVILGGNTVNWELRALVKNTNLIWPSDSPPDRASWEEVGTAG